MLSNLKIELVRIGPPKKGETRSSNTHCRRGHDITPGSPNRKERCRVCWNARSAELTARTKARLQGKELAISPFTPCPHPKPWTNPVVSCRECMNTSHRATERR